MRIYLIDFLPPNEYAALFGWVKRQKILLPSKSTFSPKQHRYFDKLYVRASDVVMLLREAYSNDKACARYDFTRTNIFIAIQKLSNAFKASGIDIDIPKPIKSHFEGDKLIISRVFDSWECNTIRGTYFRAEYKNLPKLNKLSYVTTKELESMKTLKIYGRGTKKLIKELERLFKDKEKK